MFTGQPVKPESRAEKRAKQKESHLRSDGMPAPTMEKLWKERSSIKSKMTHWNTSGPFGGSTTHAACGIPLEISEHSVLVELVTCFECQLKAAKAWESMARYSRGIEVDEEDYD